MALTNFNDSIEVACPYCGRKKKVDFDVLGTDTESIKRAWCSGCDGWYFVAASIEALATVYAVTERKVGDG